MHSRMCIWSGVLALNVYAFKSIMCDVFDKQESVKKFVYRNDKHQVLK